MMREDWVEIRFDGLISNVSTSNNKVKQREYLQKGLYPVIDQGQELIGGYIDDEEKIVECNLPVIVFGDHTKIVKYINFKFAPGADGTKILEPKRMVEPKYLYYVTKFVAKKIEDRGYARHYQYLRKESVFVAPAPEQRAIVAKIEELFSELDSGIESLKKAKEQLEVYRQSVLKAAFDGKLSNSEGEGWQETSFNKLIKNISISKNKVKQRDYLLEGKYPVIDQGQELIGGYINDEEKIVECNLPAIVFGDHTKVVKYVNFEFAPGGDGTKIFEAERGIQTKYLYYVILFLSKKIKDKGYARHYQYLKKENILLAPLAEQEEIIKEIESRLSVCENIEANTEEALEKAEALRHSILKKAFEGKLLSKEELEGCKQEDDWEPAEKLLKRIKEANKEDK